jgi:hypothetical protein
MLNFNLPSGIHLRHVGFQVFQITRDNSDSSGIANYKEVGVNV